MDAQYAREFFGKYQAMLEEIWLEKQCCRNFILDKALLSEVELDRLLEDAKRNPENRKIAAETFASSREALVQFGFHDTVAKHLAAKPPIKGKQN